MYEIDQSRQLEVLRWLMYAWDGQWLSRTGAVYGSAEANKINSRVRTAFGKVEMKALLALLGKKEAADLPDATQMLKSYFGMAFGERGFEGQFKPVEAGPGGGPRLQVEIKHLMPLDTLKKAAQAAGENPTLACESLWTSWLETLLPDAHIQVTMRSATGADLYLIDSLGESFSPAAQPTFQPAPAAAPATPSFAAPSPAEPLSPIAAALQIPLEQVAPPPAAMLDPYASGPASYVPPPQPSGMIGSSEKSSTSGGRISLSQTEPNSLASLPTPPFSGLPTPPFEASPPVQSNPPTGPGSAAAFALDPTTGRALFSSDMEQEARSKVGREKSKNPNLLTRLMTSKEGREMLAKSADQPVENLPSVAESINQILQRRLQEIRATRPDLFPQILQVIGTPAGDLQIVNGPQIYEGVDEIPPGPVQQLVKQAVQEWSNSQN